MCDIHTNTGNSTGISEIADGTRQNSSASNTDETFMNETFSFRECFPLKQQPELSRESWVLQPHCHTPTAPAGPGTALGTQTRNIPAGVPSSKGASRERSRCFNPVLDRPLQPPLN